MPPSLLSLPNEILDMIGKLLCSTTDINSLARTNKLLFTIFDDYLYKIDQRARDFPKEMGVPSLAVGWAARTGCIATMRKAIRAGANVRVKCHDTLRLECYDTDFRPVFRPVFPDEPYLMSSPLCLSLNERDLVMVRFLVEQGADVNYGVLSMGLTPLLVALFAGDIVLVKLLVSLGAQHPPDSDYSVLAAAARSYNTVLVKYLLSLLHTGSGHFINTFGAFHEAIAAELEQEGLEITILLLESGKLDPNELYYGNTPFSLACSLDRTDIAAVLLADERVDPNIRPGEHGLLPIQKLMRENDGALHPAVKFLVKQPGVEYDCFEVFSWACEVKWNDLAKKMIKKVDLFDVATMVRWLEPPVEFRFINPMRHILQRCKENIGQDPDASTGADAN